MSTNERSDCSSLLLQLIREEKSSNIASGDSSPFQILRDNLIQIDVENIKLSTLIIKLYFKDKINRKCSLDIVKCFIP